MVKITKSGSDDKFMYEVVNSKSTEDATSVTKTNGETYAFGAVTYGVEDDKKDGAQALASGMAIVSATIAFMY